MHPLPNYLWFLKILKNRRYSCNECIPEQDFLSIRVLKDVLECRRVRGALFEGSSPGNQVDSLPGAFSHDFCNRKVYLKLIFMVTLSI